MGGKSWTGLRRFACVSRAEVLQVRNGIPSPAAPCQIWGRVCLSHAIKPPHPMSPCGEPQHHPWSIAISRRTRNSLLHPPGHPGQSAHYVSVHDVGAESFAARALSKIATQVSDSRAKSAQSFMRAITLQSTTRYKFSSMTGMLVSGPTVLKMKL